MSNEFMWSNKLRGVTASDQPDLTGQWQAQMEGADGSVSETYDLVVWEGFPGVFRLEGEAAGPLDGAVIATSRNNLNAYVTVEARPRGRCQGV